VIGLIVSLIVVGLVAGILARLLVPGRQDISVPMTILIGIIGSFVGGFLGYLIFDRDSQDGFVQPSGIFGSVMGAVIVCRSSGRARATRSSIGRGTARMIQLGRASRRNAVPAREQRR
jgi:uncharacterized membrane protein YeaQ/YmgE (transglycosylase-associated protein family)